MISRDTGRPVIGADELADRLGMHRPTPQQRAVIESEPTPALVIAGAGSGKTETMAGRVIWLLANGYVVPSQILGLTFTRKAAGELADRIRERIGQLEHAGLLAGVDPFDTPSVATYNAFANGIFRDNAILLGRDSDGAVLGEASAWQLARSIVTSSSDERLIGLDKNVDTITGAVLTIGRALSENIADAADVRRMAEQFERLADLPTGGKGEYSDVVSLARSVGALPVLLDLAEQVAAAKLRDGFVEYSDQVALALELVRGVPSVRDSLRERFSVVLLDEYQDTSVVQTWLLSELFSGTAVMAVGDPNQSIYGWRGASAANLQQFANQFGGGGAQHFSLTTSWRNGHEILAVANTLVEPLAADAGVAVERLRASPAASDHPVDVVIEETLADEANAVARWLKIALAGGGASDPPSAAILFRTRKTQPAFVRALREHGVPFHVLGVAGLMAEPEVADLVCALSVLNDPNAGSELIRLLAGSRWRIGVRDLHRLGRLASWLRDRDLRQQPVADELKQKLRASVAEEEGGSIIDALDFIAHAPAGHGMLSEFSEVGLVRLREAGLLFARLRSRTGLDLLDLVTVVEQELLLDIEVAANESRSAGAANLDAFFDALGGYLAINDRAGLGGFLGWLREAEWREGLAPRPEDPEPGTVQLLTIHGAKGLEWDLVVVPRLVEDELPSSSREGYSGWLSFGALPYEFRGDAGQLPVFSWRSAATRKELLHNKKEFSTQVRAAHDREERRLAYVAVTRARHRLLLCGSFWASQSSARAPSPFLRELADAGVIKPLPAGSEYDQNPNGDELETILWPMDPLGGRRPAVESAAELVRSASPGNAGAWQRELDLLLEERDRALNAVELMELPHRVPASRFKDFVTSPQLVASALRRPMPQRPYRAGRLGTQFHRWVEDRYEVSGVAEVIDAGPAEVELDDSVADAEQLTRLREIFERSRWAQLRPIEVERELHLPFDGRVVVCKIDAVFRIGERYEIVDWKTGRAPRTPEELEERQLQLALYRIAFARWMAIPESAVDAVFYYVADDLVIEPERLYDERELIELWRQATTEPAAP